MAFGDPYMSVDEFKELVGTIENASDAAILRVLKSASRQIDGYCSQRFDQTAADVIKYLTADSYGILSIPPLTTITALATDVNGTFTYTTTWATTDYDLRPYEAAGLSEPYREIHVTPLGLNSFPTFGRGVKITGPWGWPAIPDTVKEVCFLIGNRGKALWTAPFGQTGAGELGAGLNMTAALTPLLKEMLAPYRAMYLVGAV